MFLEDLITPKKLDEVLENADNAAVLFDEEEQKAIAEKVYSDYENDRSTLDGWYEKYDKAMELALQIVHRKSHPWPGAANVKYPLVIQSAIAFNARAYPALMNGINPVKGQVVGRDDQGIKTQIALAVEKHMNYQLLQQMEEWEEDMDRMLLILPIVGTAFKKTYRDLESNQNVSKLILPKHLILNYNTDPNRFHLTRKTEVFEDYPNEIIENIRKGIYLDPELDKPTGINKDELHKDNSDEATGQENTGEIDDGTPYVQIEQHTWLDLDGDGYSEPYIVTVNVDHTKLLRIVPRFNGEEGILRNDKGEITFIEPIEFYTKFGFIPNPDGGVYDVGFGQLLGPISNTVDTTINQILDAGTMSNLPSGFVGKGARLNAKTIRLKPGEWKVIPTRGSSIKDNLFPVPSSEPSNVLLALLQLMIQAGQTLASSTEIMQGGEQPHNQKATTSNILQEESMRIFTAIYKRIRKSLSKEYRKLFILNSLYEDPRNIQNVLDFPNLEEYGNIYDPTQLNVVPAADPTTAIKEQRIQTLYQVLQIGAQFGNTNLPIVQRRLYEAMEVAGIDEIMPMNPDGSIALPPPPPSFEEIELRSNTLLKMREQDIDLLKIVSDADIKTDENRVKASDVMAKIIDSENRIKESNAKQKQSESKAGSS